MSRRAGSGSDRSQFTYHFKWLVGVTSRQFRTSARIAHRGIAATNEERERPRRTSRDIRLRLASRPLGGRREGLAGRTRDSGPKCMRRHATGRASVPGYLVRAEVDRSCSTPTSTRWVSTVCPTRSTPASRTARSFGPIKGPGRIHPQSVKTGARRIAVRLTGRDGGASERKHRLFDKAPRSAIGW